MMIKRLNFNLGKKWIFKKQLVQVYSHPRSGTHFLEAFIGENFYKNRDLSLDTVEWGHWSDRRTNIKGNRYGKLFGNHYFPSKNQNYRPKVYIYRDGRSVAYSIWKTDNFLHKNLKELEFNEFLRTKIDWKGSPSNRSEEELTILEHWAQHVVAWKDFANNNPNICLIQYEELVQNPYDQYLKLREYFFSFQGSKKEYEIVRIEKNVGLLPNSGTIDSWKKIFTKRDLKIFNSVAEEYDLQNYIKTK